MKIKATKYHKFLYLEDGQLLPPDPACVFCSSIKRYPFYSLQNNPEVLLLKCGNCGAASASRLPTTEALDFYYKKYYSTLCFEGKNERVTFQNTRKFGSYLAQKIIKHIKKSSSLSILDFGGGDGSIALKSAEQLIGDYFSEISITVIDYNEVLTRTNDSRISLKYHRTLDSLPPIYFDFVIASAVIEHIPRPRETIDRLSSLLKGNGIFYFRTPYIEPFLKISGLLHLRYLDFTFPAHIHDLGIDFWESGFTKILFPNNFKVLESNPSVVETSLNDSFFRTAAAYIFKAPWYIFGNYYKFVGGWEVLLMKV